MRFLRRYRPARADKPAGTTRPRLERLEDRCVPSIDMVTNLSGSATVVGSLPYEVAHAAANDTIEFAPNLFGGDIRLNQPLVLAQNLTVDGHGANITIDGSNSTQVFDIQAAANVGIGNVTITGGVAVSSGGGILVESGCTLFLFNSTVTGCSAPVSGGGIFNNGTLSMIGDTVSHNVSFNSSIPAGDGGGIGNHGVLSMTDCTVAFNTSFLGGGIENEHNLTMSNCTVAGNSLEGAGADGGGLEISSGTVDLLNCIFANGPSAVGALHPDIDGMIDQAQANIFSTDVSAEIITDRSGNHEGITPDLGPLQNNGGTTATFALLASSPVGIGDGATKSAIPGLSVDFTDQRGYARPLNSVDIGAFQTQTGIVADFAGKGVQEFNPSGWQVLTTFDAQSVAVDGRGDVVAAFAGDGLWRRTPDTVWTQIDGFTPQSFVVDRFGQVTAAFGGAGLWFWEGSTWKQIDSFTPQSIAVDGLGDVIAAFTGGGLWRHTLAGAGAWTQIDTFTPQSVAADGQGDVAAAFAGGGLWRWTPNGGWAQIDGVTPQGISMDAAGDVVASFAGAGLWRWTLAGGWTQIDTFTPQQFAADADGDVVASFADGTVWRWLLSSGWTKLMQGVQTNALGVTQF
jgi:hypothetical protein